MFSNMDNSDTITLMILIGLLSLVVANLIEGYNAVISNGILLGGYTYMVDVIISNWGDMDNKLKILLTSISLFKIMYYAHLLKQK